MVWNYWNKDTGIATLKTITDVGKQKYFSSYKLCKINATYQIPTNFDGVFKDGPNHTFFAVWCGQRAKITVIFSPVHSRKQIIHGHILSDACFITWEAERALAKLSVLFIQLFSQKWLRIKFWLVLFKTNLCDSPSNHEDQIGWVHVWKMQLRDLRSGQFWQ